MNASERRLTAQAEFLGAVLVDACRLEIAALKPGNVGAHGDGHGMTADDFIASADAIRGPMCAPDASVGGRIEASVVATRAAVGCNTNLGIVLLCAPLVQAALHAALPLREALADVLAGLDRDDAAAAYRAIRHARPGGLGKAERHDVATEPQVTLLEAMRSAADRDAIARQYATAYAEVFDIALPRLRAARARWHSARWAATDCYLGWLSRMPDSLVLRKQGREIALQVQSQAAEWSARLDASSDPSGLTGPLLDLDKEFKARGINPGTSADLTVASLFADTVERESGTRQTDRATAIEKQCT